MSPPAPNIAQATDRVWRERASAMLAGSPLTAASQLVSPSGTIATLMETVFLETAGLIFAVLRNNTTRMEFEELLYVNCACSCYTGWTGATCNITTCPGPSGGCSGHGTCILGVCHCTQVCPRETIFRLLSTSCTLMH